MNKLDMSLIFQISVTVKDMDECLNNWRSCFDIDENTIIRKSTKEIYDTGKYHCKNFLEKEVEFYHKYYRFDLAGLDMEMIEPITLDNINPYTDFLNRSGNGLQHLGVKINNRDELVAGMKEMGIPIYTYAYQGPKTDVMSERADCYFYDLREQLGIIIEAGGAVVGPLATDPRAGNQQVLGLLNSFAARPQLPEIKEIKGIVKTNPGHMYQLGVVVANADESFNNYIKLFGIDESSADRGGEQGEYKFIKFELGGIEIKLIQPESDNIYSQFLKDMHGNNIMYIGTAIDDVETFKENMNILNVPLLAELTEDSGDKSDKNAYIYDMREKFGLIIKVGKNR